MRQVVQNIGKGRLQAIQVPEPFVQPGEVLIANEASVISVGTEKMLMELAKKSLLGKARERPDQVRRVLEKVRTEGFLNTARQVFAKLDEPLPMGYASSGTVLACGAGVQEFKPGDRVASNGPHAEVVSVPRHLCAGIPDEVPTEHAAFTVLGAIALQGIRLAQVDLGGTALVIGLGLVGQLTVQMLRAGGVQVICTDPDTTKCSMAKEMGAVEAQSHLSAQTVERLTRGLGADAVLITASTRSNEPVELAAQAVRKKGRIVLVGVVGLELDRRAFYFKECEFVVSCSYGPGRYDPSYEEKGIDYPAGYVRWTEQRNMQAVLDLMASGRLNVGPFISHRFPIHQAEEAYALIQSGSEPYLGILLQYPGPSTERTRRIELRGSEAALGKIGLGVIGAGNFARMRLLPCFTASKLFEFRILCSAKGLSAATLGEKLNFAAAASGEEEVCRDPTVSAVCIATRHSDHGQQVVKSLRAGKHVFVEKPLCLTVEELEQIESTLWETAQTGIHSVEPGRDSSMSRLDSSLSDLDSGFRRNDDSSGRNDDSTDSNDDSSGRNDDFSDLNDDSSGRNDDPVDLIGRDVDLNDNPGRISPSAISFQPTAPSSAFSFQPSAPSHSSAPLILMVGFNRRFSRAALLVKEFFHGTSAPLTISIRFNAGPIPEDHWTQDEETGGGRIIGEACHAIDLATFLAGSPPVRVFAESVGGENAPDITDDQCFITLRHANGSVSGIAYLAGGDKAFPKERVEVFGGGRVAVIEDFREVIMCANGKTRKVNLHGQDKGHQAEIEAFGKAIASGGPAPIPWVELRAVTLASILAVRSIREGRVLSFRC